MLNLWNNLIDTILRSPDDGRNLVVWAFIMLSNCNIMLQRRIYRKIYKNFGCNLDSLFKKSF